MTGAVPEPADLQMRIREITRRHEIATDAMTRGSDAAQAPMKVHLQVQAAAAQGA